MKKSTKRLLFLTSILFVASFGMPMFFSFFQENLEFYIETDRLSEIKNDDKVFRIGGIIKSGSIKIFEDKKEIHFTILDRNYENPIIIINHGLWTPPIFKEDSGIIVKGKFDKKNHLFHSYEVIGKHDENYMPPGYKK